MEISLLSAGELVALQQLIDVNDRIVICGHRNPDGDAIGSSLGWADYLRSLGKEPVVVMPDMFPDYLQWLPGAPGIVRYDKHPEQVERLLAEAGLVFCLDFSRYERVDSMGDLLEASPAQKVVIDHHPDPYIDTVLTVSHPEMSSTCELVFRVIWQLGGFDTMTARGAVPIYCGMMTDTGGFTYNSASPEIYFIISQLLTKHIDKDKIYRNVYHNYSEWRMRLIGFVLYNKLHVYPDRHASYFSLTRNDLYRFHYTKGDAEGLVNMPLQIKGLKLSISLREDTERNNVVWVSLRSVDDFSCTAIAEKYFNGGGHLNASGGRLLCSMEEAERIAQKAIHEIEN